MAWQVPVTFEEKLKAALVPPGLYIRHRAAKEWRKGEAEIRLLPQLVARDKVALDIGANKGVYSYYLAGLARHVHAFEPNPKLVAQLARHLSSNATLHAMALGDVSGTADLKIPHGAKGYSNQRASFTSAQLGDAFGVISVAVNRLDDLDIRDVGFMKIDVEGFEREMLAGATETIKREKPNLLIEIEENHTGVPAAEVISQVRDLGYLCLFLKHGVLTSLDSVDLSRHTDPSDRENYVFNFIFLPR
jgi:FkbM family methyltransferase